jgi:hypothetical protein
MIAPRQMRTSGERARSEDSRNRRFARERSRRDRWRMKPANGGQFFIRGDIGSFFKRLCLN